MGVFAHEYGHDLGLPDLYDTASGGDSDVDFWDLMSSGSHSGPIFQSMPTHMGIWDKWVLGWADPVVIEPGAARTRATCNVGQTSRTPKGTADGVKINLPDQDAHPRHAAQRFERCGTPAPTRTGPRTALTRDVAVPAGASDARFWMWNDYTIEEDWDFGFVEVSTDGGTTWSEQVVKDETGTGRHHARRLRRPERPHDRLRRQEVRPHR